MCGILIGTGGGGHSLSQPRSCIYLPPSPLLPAPPPPQQQVPLQFNSRYGEHGPNQGLLRKHGNAYVNKKFPDVDRIIRAKVQRSFGLSDLLGLGGDGNGGGGGGGGGGSGERAGGLSNGDAVSAGEDAGGAGSGPVEDPGDDEDDGFAQNGR